MPWRDVGKPMAVIARGTRISRRSK